ncbi:MAG: hypothetical protein JWN70_694 [Planctomycetaceae bacterium]|nr:hypothetical protein [Planctomycetaceae bacterium]
MAIAAAQAQKFYEQVTAERRVFTFLNDDSFLVFKVGSLEVVPFWSSATRLDSIMKTHPKYREYTTDESTLEHFLATTLPLLHQEKINIGVNWSGTRLTGYDISASDLQKNLNYWLSQQRG